jgi:multidrug efflux system outer membrane protein
MRPLLLAWAVSVAGCGTSPPPEIEAPELPARFRHDASSMVVHMRTAEPWWQGFGDATLTDLMERCTRGNFQLRAALARLQQAQALARLSSSARQPQLAAAGRVVREAPPGAGGRGGTLSSLGVNLSYEVDLVGRLAAASSAAESDARSREAALHDLHLVLQAEGAQLYFALRALDAEQSLLQETLAAYGQTMRLVERRHGAGDIAELDLVRLRAEVATTEAEALALHRRRAELQNALALLLGEPAGGFDLRAGPWAERPPLVPPGLPSDVLERRPDVAAAHHALIAARSRVGVTQRAWFPSLSLTAAGGFASPELSDLLKAASREWGLGALLALPLLDGGRREAQQRASLAEFDAVQATYRERVLGALRDVEDQLAALQWLEGQRQAQARAVDAAQRATQLSEVRYRNGLVSQLELLDSRRSELRSRRAALQVRAAQLHSTVGLVRALGGGWNSKSG